MSLMSRLLGKGWYAKRWRVLQRDNFTCQYCGQYAPDVMLHVDHKNPVANGGTDEEQNLITSCEACNIGKHTSRLIMRAELEQDEIPFSARLAGPSGPHVGGSYYAVFNYIMGKGFDTATNIAIQTGLNRAGVAKVLARYPHTFVRIRKEGKNVYYGLGS